MARYEDLVVTKLTVLGNCGIAGTLDKIAYDETDLSADFKVNTDKFVVTATSGNTAIAGTLGVTGAATVGGTLGVTGKVTLSSLLELQQVAVASLPAASAANDGCVVYCTNGDAGSPCLAVSNGTNWLRIALGTAVSAT